MATYNVDFEPLGRRGECRGDGSLLACARRLGVGIGSVCGGRGTCHSCRVQLVRGVASEVTAHEREALSPQELEAGWRLACQARPVQDCVLGIPPESLTARQRTQVEGLAVTVPLAPAVRGYAVELTPPKLSDARADADRLLAAIQGQHGVRCDGVDLAVLRTLPEVLRAEAWRCRAMVRGTEVVALSPWDGRCLGLAVDLGTTKIAGYLVDLGSGQTLAATGVINPQTSYGEDVISRLGMVLGDAANAVELQAVVVGALNGLVRELCDTAGCRPRDIVEAVVAANTAMHHLFLGLPVSQLARSPFVPAVSGPVEVKAREIGLDFAPGAYVHALPNIAGFVGGDHVAALLATEPWCAGAPVLLLDIGTNTEVSLTTGGATTAVSCPSGPAFEGGHIRDGMRAAAGAIERMRIAGDQVQYQTVDDAPPVGICGSGILDAVSHLYLAGVIDPSGRMRDGHPRIRSFDGQREFVLADERDGQPAIAVLQKDVREVQLAKAAIRAGIQVLLEAEHCSEDQLGQVVIAGAFGSYIDVASAITIGLLPALPLDRFRQVGNAAGAGARMALLSQSKRAEARSLASRVKYIELAGSPAFRDAFLSASALGRYRIAGRNREEVL